MNSCISLQVIDLEEEGAPIKTVICCQHCGSWIHLLNLDSTTTAEKYQSHDKAEPISAEQSVGGKLWTG